MNEYTAIGGVARGHDDNGNLLADGSREYVWDYKNRLVGVVDPGTGQPVSRYLYYCDNRRAVKELYSQTNPGVVETATAFYYDGWQVCEEQNALSGATLVTYVWSPVYIDQLLEYTRTTSHPLGAGTFYVHQSARSDVVAITNGSGSVVETVRYDDFGNAEFRDAGGSVLAAGSAVGNPYGFQGRRLDAETGLYYFRNRFYDPATGRFLQRDPVWDAANFGGWYSFVGNSPVSGLDPMGLKGMCPSDGGILNAFIGGIKDHLDGYQEILETLGGLLDGDFEFPDLYPEEMLELLKDFLWDLIEKVPWIAAGKAGVEFLAAIKNATSGEQLAFMAGGIAAGAVIGYLGGKFLKGALGNLLARFKKKDQPLGARGPSSGRDFDPTQAGGPIHSLNTDRIKVSDRGIGVVERHLARFGDDASNQVMVERLRRIAAGEIQPTQADLNFYSHELREYVRYRNLGVPEGAQSLPGKDPYDLWNNAHTATLEDYGLREGPGVLYHPSAEID